MAQQLLAILDFTILAQGVAYQMQQDVFDTLTSSMQATQVGALTAQLSFAVVLQGLSTIEER